MRESFPNAVPETPQFYAVPANTVRAAMLSLALLTTPADAKGPEGEAFAKLATVPQSCLDPQSAGEVCQRDIKQLVEQVKQKIGAGGVLRTTVPVLARETPTTERCKISAELLERRKGELEHIIAFTEFLMQQSDEAKKRIMSDDKLLKGTVDAWKHDHPDMEPSPADIANRLRTNLAQGPKILRECGTFVSTILGGAFTWPASIITQGVVEKRILRLIDLAANDLENTKGEKIDRVLPAARALDAILALLRDAATQK